MNRLNLIAFITILVYTTSVAQEPNYRKDDEIVHQSYVPDANQNYEPIKLAVNFVFLHGDSGDGTFMQDDPFVDEFIELCKSYFKNQFVDKYYTGYNIDRSIFDNEYLNYSTIELDINPMWVESDKWDYTRFSFSLTPNHPYYIADEGLYYIYLDESQISNSEIIITHQELSIDLDYPNSRGIIPETGIRYLPHDDDPTQTPNVLIKDYKPAPNAQSTQAYFYDYSHTYVYQEEISEVISIPEIYSINDILIGSLGTQYKISNQTFYFDGNKHILRSRLFNQIHPSLAELNEVVSNDQNYEPGINIYFIENGDIIRAVNNGVYDKNDYLGKVLQTHESMLPTDDFNKQHHSYISSLYTKYLLYKNGYVHDGHETPELLFHRIKKEYPKGGIAHETGHNLNLRHGGTIYEANEVENDFSTRNKFEFNSDEHGRHPDWEETQTKDLRHAVFSHMISPNSVRNNTKHHNNPNHILGDNILYALNTIRHSSSRLNVGQYFTNDSFDNTNLYVSQDVNEIWDFYYRSYSNIIVDGNKNLRVNDSLVMAPQSKIGIKNNSYVVLDSNSKLNPLKYNNIEWKGFEIEDNSYLLIKPDAKIPDNFNAEIIEQGMSRLEVISFNESVPQNSLTKATNSVLDEEDRSSILYQSIKNSNITVNPNPADDYIKISSGSIPIKTVMITDMNGQLIKKTNENFDNIDISGISNGIYILNITTVDNNTEFKKVIIE